MQIAICLLGRKARNAILHCMQSRLVSVAGSFPVCGASSRVSATHLSSAPEKSVETAEMGWKLMFLSLDLALASVRARWLLVMTSLLRAP